jgi:hypothetical protein
MIAVTYGVTRRPAARNTKRTQAQPRKGFFARLLDALAESRMRQAHREITRHAHLLPPDHS